MIITTLIVSAVFAAVSAGLNASDEMETPTKKTEEAAAREIEQAIWEDEDY